ncbi:MAG: DUF99 family protein [DPANN group archaeon]|nr:DUF99 family protein [DPANN group archaeon]
MKKEIRILGIDDAPFNRNTDENVLVVGVVLRGADYMDVVLSSSVEVDGIDATQKIIKLVNDSRTKDQLRCIMLDGIALAGFNVVNINALHKATGLPVIVFIKDRPDFTAIKKALVHLDDGDDRMKLIEAAGKIQECEIENKAVGRKGIVYFQVAGTDAETACNILELTCRHGLVPEPLRVAHMVAQGIVFGESKGRA